MYTKNLLFGVALLLGLGQGGATPGIAQAPVDTASHNPMGDEAGHTEKPESKPHVASTVLDINIGGQAATSLHLADLQAMPQTTVEVFNAHTKMKETYSGPLVAAVLAKAGLALAEKTQHSILDSYVLCTGTDGYFVVYSGAELQPGLHKTPVIVAIAQSGHPLTGTGTFQIIDPEDIKPARWVRNLKGLAVVPVAAPAP